MDISSSVRYVPLIGPRFATRLKKLSIETVKDLVYHFPYRYEDYTLISDIKSLQPGETATVKGQIITIKNIYTRGGRKIQTATLSDGERNIEVTWFNQPFLIKILPPGTWVSLSGKIGWFSRKKAFISPDYEKLSTIGQGTLHTGRLVPIYPETYGLNSKWLRSRIAPTLPEVLHQIEEFLPAYVREQNKFLELSEAIEKIHFPKTQDEAQEARRRLSFDELFSLHLTSLTRRQDWTKNQLAHRLVVDQEKVLEFIGNLPFNLTLSQKRAMREIADDLSKNSAMNRLLEGDVGSGKTVVAALACFIASSNGYQSAVMAPTQILAMQHFQTLENVLRPLGVQVALVTGERRKVKSSEWQGVADVTVGTHSLIQKAHDFERLALVVIDEQHRFGVAQRALLAQKGDGVTSHVLTMTATPIPRTVALALYGDLDLSTLDELPKGRVKIKTWTVPSQKRASAYRWIRKHVKDTIEQAFIVCPLIEESQIETMKSVKAVTAEFDRLSNEEFPDLRLGLLHGRLKVGEKEKVMQKMREGKIDILVATPVVEVGIDMPNATIMMIEGAERFGLAQLHQLRGRVGRGTKQSYCLLFTESQSEKVSTRLRAMERTMSGRMLAELDLKLRGPGEIYGTEQHGFPELKIASFSDVGLVKKAQETAESLVKDLKKYPRIQEIIREKEKITAN
ncbi:MAG: ATP-dependent DNA helicase RecG [bacterium]|nr:ATP-dependent DNA helicase RecG [bacterium]